MFDAVDFFKYIWPFVLFNNFMKYVKLYVYIKVYLTINQMIEKELIIT